MVLDPSRVSPTASGGALLPAPSLVAVAGGAAGHVLGPVRADLGPGLRGVDLGTAIRLGSAREMYEEMI